MAEVRNTFIGSKMNKDLEQRLVPNSEYRDAYNVMISRSEGEDAGSLENVLGNIKLTDFGIDQCEVEAIGVFFDVITNRVYAMLTNYVDTSDSKLDHQALGGVHAIVYVDLNSNISDVLVKGDFLNFSKTHPIFGINLVNDYLFFTDNRNQPRKINVKNAIDNPATSPSPYYINEEQISIVKVFPELAIPLQVRDIVGLDGLCEIGTQNYTTTPPGEIYRTIAFADMGGSIGFIETNGFGMTVRITAAPDNSISTLEIVDRGYGYGEYENERIYICQDDGTFDVNNGAYFKSIGGGSCCSFIWNSAMKDVKSELLPDGTTANPFYNPDYDGDYQFLENKFVRFAYRFQFDDDEYSLISPFTPEAFIPKQDGYFIGDDEEKTYKSTEVEFMENKVNQIELQFRAPDRLRWRDAVKKYNINSIDIIMKESTQSSLTNIYTIEIDELSNHPSALFQHVYKGDKPVKTLPQKDLLRVYDQAPVRALCQEFTDGAVVYGNFLDKHTPPKGIDFNITADIKQNREANLPSPGIDTSIVTRPKKESLRKTSPNHTLKQNRNYKVGIVLSDKFGRQSSVLNTQPLPYTLKGVPPTSTQNTYYHPFKDGVNGGPIGTPKSDNTFAHFGCLADPVQATDQNLFGPPKAGGGAPIPANTWPGDVLNAQLNETINSIRNATTGTPGLYSEGGILLDVKVISSTGNLWYSGGGGVATTINGVTDPIDPSVLLSYADGISDSEEYCYATLEWDSDNSNPDGAVPRGNLTSVSIITANQLEGTYNVGDTLTITNATGTDTATLEVTSVTPANPLGWYSYKFVVQQQEQEYYNAYTPGILNGYIDGAYFPQNKVITKDASLDYIDRYYDGYLNVATPSEPVIHFALHGDNINKVPRDLSLLGPTDTLFRTGRPSFESDPSYYQFRDTNSELFTIDPYDPEGQALLKDKDRQRGIDSGSVLTNASLKFWPRVTNNSFVSSVRQPGASANNALGNPNPTQYVAFSNCQYYSTLEPSEVTTIGTGTELGLWDPSALKPYNTAKVFYNYQQNPLIAKADVIVKEPINIMSLGAIGPYWTEGQFEMGIMSVGAGSGDNSYIAGSKNIPYTNVKIQDDCVIGTFTDIAINGWVVNVNGVRASGAGATLYKEGEEGNLTLESFDSTPAAVAGSRTMTISNKGYTDQVDGLELIPDSRYVYGGTNSGANRLNFRAVVGSGDNTQYTYNQVWREFYAGSMEPGLAILEIEAIRSLLPIYWESSSSGLISELNKEIEEDPSVKPKFEINYFNSIWLKKCPKWEPVLNLHTWDVSDTNINGSGDRPDAYPPQPPVKVAAACGSVDPTLLDYYYGKLVGVWPGIGPNLGYTSCGGPIDDVEGLPKIIQTNVDLIAALPGCGIFGCDVYNSYPEFCYQYDPTCAGAFPPVAPVGNFPGACCEENLWNGVQGGWYIEESRIRGGFNNAGMTLGVRAYTVDENPDGQYRTFSAIHSGIINTRTGYNESNVFSISEAIVKDLDPLFGSVQKFYAEDTNLFTFQESKVNRILINKNALYSGDQGSQDTNNIRFFGQTYAFAGEYGISQDPGSFTYFGYRKYFVDRDRSVACRLSGDGITEISGYGMRDWFRDQLSEMTIDWKTCYSSLFEIIEKQDYSYTVSGEVDCLYIGGGVSDAAGNKASLPRITSITYDAVSDTTTIYFNTMALPYAVGEFIKLLVYKKDKIVAGWDIHNSNYTLSLERPKSGDDTISNDDSNFNYYTTCFDESVLGWISFYSYRPAQLDSLKNYFYSLKNGKLWRHYDDAGGTNYGKFYGATEPAPTFITFIFNPNPNVTKNFKTISYEGSNGWKTFGGSDLQEVYRTDPDNFTPPFTYGTDYNDEFNMVLSLDSGVFVDPTSGYPNNAGFTLKENRYVADLISKNGSTDLRPGQVLYGEAVGYPAFTPFGVMTGVKGYVLNVTFIVDDVTNVGGRKELYSTASDFVPSSF